MKQHEIKKIFDTITNETPNIIILKDYNGNFIYGNKTLATLYGTTSEALVGKTDSDYNPDTAQTDFYLKNIQDIMDKGETKIVLEESTDKNSGEKHFYHSLKKPFIDEDGNKSILVIANDITEIQKEKIKVEEKKNRLDAALDIIEEGVWDWDMETNIVSHNNQWCRMFYMDESKKEHPIEFFSTLIHDGDKADVVLRLNDALENNTMYTSTHRMVCSNGEIKWVEDRGKIVQYDSMGKPSRMIGSVRDITDSKKLQEQKILLEKQSRLAALGEMMGNISHQWRQPLSVISSLVTSLEVHKEMNTLDDKLLKDTVGSVTQQVEYLSQTINDFKNFIKNDRKTDVFVSSEVINKALSLTNAITKRAFIEVIVSNEESKKISGFESEILQVLLNIINNAKDVMVENIEDEESRLLKIYTEVKEGFLELHIQDSGGGIPNDIINRVFDPYFTTKDDSLGTGLGLYMSKQIIEDVAGHIDVVNDIFEYGDKNYKGAHFIIQFPYLDE